MNRSTFAKAGAAAAAAVLALSAGAAAQAQPYGYNGYGSGGYAYDPCKRDKTNRGTVGALIGGTIGAVIGSNAAAGGVRTEGSLLGGAVGAAIGAGVGNSSAACRSGAMPPPASSAYYGSEYGYGYEAPPQYGYDTSPYYQRDHYERGSYGYGRDYGQRDDSWAYGRRGERYRLAEGRGVDANGCTLAESPVYMPDGSSQTRFVRVCRDSSGRYAVVD